MSRAQKYYELIFCAFIFFIPFENYLRVVPNILLFSLVTFSPFILNKKKIKRSFNKNLYLLLGLCVYALVHSLFLSNQEKDISFFVKVFSVCVISILAIPINNGDKIKLSCIFSAVVCIILSLFNITQYYFLNGNFDFSNGEIINKLLILERLYIGFVCVISIIFSYFLYSKTNNKRHKWFYVLYICLSIIFIFIISARIAILTSLVLIVLKILHLKNRALKIKMLGFVMLFLTIAFALNNNLRNRIFFENREESFIESIKVWEPRFAIWECVIEVNKTESFNNLVGLGKTKTKEELLNCYDKNIKNVSKRKWFLNQSFNAHNQFFEIYLSYGIIGVFLFTGFLISVFKNRTFMGNAFLVTLILFALVESFLQRQIGVYLFALVLITVSQINIVKQKDK